MIELFDDKWNPLLLLLECHIHLKCVRNVVVVKFMANRLHVSEKKNSI